MPIPKYSRRPTALRAGRRLAETILDFVGQIPETAERPHAAPETRAHAIARAAARQAAITSGSLTLPPGAVGWLTLLPELRALWVLQMQVVADIAGAYGKKADLGREEMLYCLFRHTDAKSVRDLVTQMGRRFVVQRASRPELQAIALKIGLHLSQRLIGKGLARWLPVLGAIGAGAYAYYDTALVADSAIELFDGVIDVRAEDFPDGKNEPAQASDIR